MIKNYVEMVKDDVDKVIKTGEYDYIIENCKTEDELRDRLYDTLLTDVRVTGNNTRSSSYYSDFKKTKKSSHKFWKRSNICFWGNGFRFNRLFKSRAI